MAKASSKTKLELLEAAARIVKEQGASQLTLEAVAKKAGVSKGGLLYHYPNKSALLAAMVTHLIESFEKAIEQTIEQSEGKISWLEAYVILSFDPSGSLLAESAGILAAVASDPSLLEPFKEINEIWQEKVEANGLDPVVATIIRLAADGLWYTELFDVSPFTEEKRSQVLKALLTLIKEKTNHD